MEVAVSSFFYKKFVCVPLNIVFYNVFSSHSKGPNIFGTEPWHFYFRNLLINFNFWFILALLALPLLILQRWTQPQEKNKRYSRSLVFISPFYLWFIIFTLQPHKEERFMYPVYPLLALNAAISLHILLSSFGSARGTNIIHSIPPSLKLAMVSTFILSAISLGLWRIAGAATAYGAPLKVYSPLSEPGMTSAGDTVCLGKEWYRFPSSYFLPDGVRAKFVQSDFRGLLPGEFPEASQMLGAMYRASAIPLGMNDENREDPTKYVSELLPLQMSALIDCR
jgi:alpha-1,2-mannosyltransferase